MKTFEETYSQTLNEKFIIDHGYLVSCKPLPGKHSFCAVNTMWTRDNGNYEVREAGLISSTSTKAHFNLLNIPLSYISLLDQLYAFVAIGGHAVVEKNLAASHWPEILSPKVVVKSPYRGYIDFSSLENKNKQRYARGDLRMLILDRDKYQCRICGASPDDNVHIRLEVHHIRPWSEGGISLPDNLITLCISCHEGAAMIDRNVLYNKIGLRFSNLPHEIFAYRDNWQDEERACFQYLLSNTVVMKMKNNLVQPL